MWELVAVSFFFKTKTSSSAGARRPLPNIRIALGGPGYKCKQNKKLVFSAGLYAKNMKDFCQTFALH
jgi:hypothetical protein